MKRLTTFALPLMTAALMASGCMLTDDAPPNGEATFEGDDRFDARCANVSGPVMLPSDVARIDAAIDGADCLRIDGNLTIRGEIGSLGRFEELEQIRVSGRTVVSVSGGATDLTLLAGLTHVEGDFVVEESVGLVSTEGLLRLQRVGGDFRISGNDDLRLVHGPKTLRQIGADLIVEDNPVVCDMTGFDGLQYIAEYDDVGERPDPAGEFGGTNPETRPGIVDPHIIVTDNPQLKRIEGFGGLTDIDGDIRLERNDELVTIRGFEQLEFMTGRLVIRDQPFLQNIDALVRPSCLREVVLENTGLTDFTAFSEVWEIGRLEVVDNDGLAGLGGFREELRLRGPVIVSGNEALRNMSGLGGVVTIDRDRDGSRNLPSIYRETANALCVETSGSDETSDLIIEGNGALEVLGLTRLEEIQGDLIVRGNATIADLSGLAAVRRISGDFVVEENALLREVAGFDGIRTLVGTFVVADNPALQRLDGFNNLDLILGEMTIVGNASLRSMEGFRVLAEVDSLVVTSNGVTDLDAFAALKEARSIDISDNPDLEQMNDFVSLETVEEDLRVENNPSLLAVELVKLSAAGGVVIQNNPNLSQCDVEALIDGVLLNYALIEDNGSCG